jgi:hypothetical protein
MAGDLVLKIVVVTYLAHRPWVAWTSVLKLRLLDRLTLQVVQLEALIREQVGVLQIWSIFHIRLDVVVLGVRSRRGGGTQNGVLGLVASVV